MDIFKKYYLSIFYIFIIFQITYSQHIIKKVTMPVGNSENCIMDDGEPFGAGLPNTHFCLDNNLNIYIYDILNRAIKKYDLNGEYLGKITTPFSTEINITCFENIIFTGKFSRVYTGDFSSSVYDNRLFIYDTDSMRLKTEPLQLFNSPYIRKYVQYDSLLVFSLPFDKFNVYDMARHIVYKSVKNPFIYLNLSEIEKTLLFKKVLENYDVKYLGKIAEYLVLLKSSEIKDEYIVGLFDVENNVKQESKFNCRRDGFMTTSLDKTSHLIEDRYLFFMGYEEKKHVSNDNVKGYISINIIDLQILFPKVKFPDVQLFTIQDKKNRMQDINSSTSYELKLKRNEIFARHGRIFKTKLLQEYFNNQAWYKVNPNYSDSLLTENDKENIKRIIKIEKERGSAKNIKNSQNLKFNK